MALTIKIEGIDQIREELGAMKFTPEKLRRMNTEIGYRVQEGIADHLAEASATRHKTADALGAQHTNFLEYAPGRVRSLSKFTGNPKPEIGVDNATESGVDIVFKNTPGLRRAFGPMTITPKRAKYLTIPKDKVSYARRASELRSEGHKIFKPRGVKLLVEHSGEMEEYKDANGKTRKRKKWRVLYALASKVSIRQDRELMPSAEQMQDMALDAAEAFIAADAL